MGGTLWQVGTEEDRERLLSDVGIIRNKLKVNAAIYNAQEILKIQDDFGSWDDIDPMMSTAPQAPPPSISQTQTNDIYSAAQRIDSNPYGREAYQPQQPVLQPQNQNIMNDLTGGDSNAPVKPKIDTSFLDDLL